MTPDRQANDGLHAYDAEGNVLAADPGQSGGWSFAFDALNRRVHSQNASATSESVFDLAGRLTSGWSPGASPVQSNIYADGRLLAFRSYDAKTYFVHKDWIDADRVHTDPAGAPAATYASLPFGDGAAASDPNPYAAYDLAQFADMQDDFFSNTQNAQFRQYSQTQGRWLSPDPYDGSYNPANPQSFNRYTYALNNPVSLLDPSGLDCQAEEGGYYCDAQDCNYDDACGGDPNGDPSQNVNPGPDPGGTADLPDTSSGFDFQIPGIIFYASGLDLGAFSPGESPLPGFSGPGWLLTGFTGSVYSGPSGGGGGGGISAPRNGPQKPNPCPPGTTATTKRMLVTGYDNSYQSTQKNPGDPGYGLTASGSVAAYGTIAAPRNYAFGIQMFVPGYGLGTVLDRGGAIKNSHIDLWFPTTQQALDWGSQHLTVTVCHE